MHIDNETEVFRSQFEQKIRNNFENNTIVGFLEERNNDLNNLPIERIICSIQSLFKYGDRDTAELNDYYDLSKTDERIDGYICNMLKRIPFDERSNTIVELIKESDHGLILPFNLTQSVHWDHNRNRVSRNEPLVAKDRLNEITNAFIFLLHKFVISGKLSKKRELAAIIMFWGEWGEWEDQETVKNWVDSNILNDDSLITNFLAGFKRFGPERTPCANSRPVHLDIDPSMIASYCDIKKLKEICENLRRNKEKLSAVELDLIMNFLRTTDQRGVSS